MQKIKKRHNFKHDLGRASYVSECWCKTLIEGAVTDGGASAISLPVSKHSNTVAAVSRRSLGVVAAAAATFSAASFSAAAAFAAASLSAAIFSAATFSAAAFSEAAFSAAAFSATAFSAAALSAAAFSSAAFSAASFSAAALSAAALSAAAREDSLTRYFDLTLILMFDSD